LQLFRSALRRAAQSTLVELRKIFAYDAATLQIVLLRRRDTISCVRFRSVSPPGLVPGAGESETQGAELSRLESSEPTKKMSRND
jgi:hypothetical protein